MGNIFKINDNFAEIYASYVHKLTSLPRKQCFDVKFQTCDNTFQSSVYGRKDTKTKPPRQNPLSQKPPTQKPPRRNPPIYSIHALVNNQTLPCVFGLLPNKTENTYNRFFEEVRNAVRGLGNGPVEVLLDFERAGINAIQTQFPTAQVYGCFYHLSSNIWKHIQSSGLQAHYVNDDEFSIHLRMIAALAFVPLFDVEDAFEELALEIRNRFKIEADDVLDYFEDTYVHYDSDEMHHDVLQHFQLNYGTCFIIQRTSFLEQIMLLRGGTEDSKPTYLLSILHSGNFWMF